MNAVVVSCGENDAKRIAELVKKLDTEQVARVSEIKVFPLRFAKPTRSPPPEHSAQHQTDTAQRTKSQRPIGAAIHHPHDEGKELVTAALKEAVLISPTRA